jgi:TatD DNase family protein
VSGLVDIGANLTSTAFRGDLPAVRTRAAAAGVETIVVTGTSVADSTGAATLAAAHDGLYATAGVHPHHAKEAGGTWLDELRALARQPRVVAIGECGLDFDRNFSPRADQLRCFEDQLALAAALELPVFLHERAAHADFLAVLRNHRRGLRGAVVHCFTGTGAELDAYLALDLHIGITGWICDERRGLGLRELVGRVPLERLMLETDAPFLAPRTLGKQQRRRNEPAFLTHVLDTVAAATGHTPAAVAAATTATALRFFAIS